MHSLTVLVADDHALMRAAMASFVRALGAVVVAEATNGTEAVARAKELLPDVVVIDGNMPGLNGYEATRSIKEVHPNVRIALVTIAQGTLYEHLARTSRADAFIDKSTLKSALQQFVGRILSDRNQGLAGVAA